jgi:rod shape-determining protein MreC
MDWLSRHKRLFLLFGMAFCVAAIIFTVNPGFRPLLLEKVMAYMVVPMQRGTMAATNWFGAKINAFRETNRLVAENAVLREQIGLLTQENRRLHFADEENKELNALLNISRKYAELPTEGASIIGKDPNDWYNSFFIGKGSNDGMSRNMAVLGDHGLIGVIREVHPAYSKVITIIDSRCSVAVKNTRTDDIGVLKGDVRLMQQGLCRVDYIYAGAQILPGDEIVTSSHSSIFPAGIMVGTVLTVDPNPDGLTKFAIVQPAARINRIENVLVVNKLYGDEDATFDEPWFIEGD